MARPVAPFGIGRASKRWLGRHLLLGDGRGGGEQYSAMADRQAEVLEIVLGQVGQHLETDVVLGKRVGVSAEAKSFEPLREIIRHG